MVLNKKGGIVLFLKEIKASGSQVPSFDLYSPASLSGFSVFPKCAGLWIKSQPQEVEESFSGPWSLQSLGRKGDISGTGGWNKVDGVCTGVGRQALRYSHLIGKAGGKGAPAGASLRDPDS